jgi:hypothetical protein
VGNKPGRSQISSGYNNLRRLVGPNQSGGAFHFFADLGGNHSQIFSRRYKPSEMNKTTFVSVLAAACAACTTPPRDEVHNAESVTANKGYEDIEEVIRADAVALARRDAGPTAKIIFVDDLRKAERGLGRGKVYCVPRFGQVSKNSATASVAMVWARAAGGMYSYEVIKKDGKWRITSRILEAAA